MQKLALRIFTATLVLLLALSVISCSGEGADTESNNPPDTTENKETNITTEANTTKETEMTTEIITNPPHHDAIYAVNVTVETSEAQTEFQLHEKFNSEGIRLVALMSDGEEIELSLDYCDFHAPAFSSLGEHTVEVDYYGGEVLDYDGNDLEVLLTYTVTVVPKIMPELEGSPLANISGNGSYRLEAEMIDLEAMSVKAVSGKSLIIADSIASGEGFVANYGVLGNCFGAKFSSDKEYTGVTIKLCMANFAVSKIYPYEDLAIYLNGTQLHIDPEFWLYTRAPAVGGTEGADFTLIWNELIFEDLTVSEGENALIFDIIGENVPYFDYIEIEINS